MNTCKCETCGEKAYRATKLEKDLAKPQEQKLWSCRSCGHTQVHPIPSPEILASYYAYDDEMRKKYDFSTELKWNGGDQNQSSITYTNRLDHITKLLNNNKKLLDIGYGNGSFLRSAFERGFDVTGIDLDERFFKPEFECNLINGRIEDNPFPPNSFDVITTHHVLEHVEDLEKTTKSIFNALKPGGLWLIELPHEIGSLVNKIRRVFRPLLGHQKYTFYSSVQHIRFFCTKGLESHLKHHHFEIINCRSIPSSECVTGTASILLLPLKPLENKYDQGHFLEAIARKPLL